MNPRSPASASPDRRLDGRTVDAMQPAEPRPLTHPRDGVPPLVVTRGQLAFLVQLRRDGVGTILIDPVPLDDLSVVADAIGDAEWVLHAASQDLPCLAEVGLRPSGELFDTELAARLAGLEKVGLAAVV